MGKEIQYQFKFYNPLKKQEDGRKAIDLRGRRLQTFESLENCLAVPLSKDYSLLERVDISKRQDDNGTNKLEMKLSLRLNDNKRM